ncbi:unnamed protein product [Prorocentrum cordatum]|uniref:Selenoprotein O n=1 Tax=Prorocentrum cordatum TaxID=2364126 RepID=A0ABN9RDC4_9DINO|nr:unnamed protein product [Polarella glacialis]
MLPVLALGCLVCGVASEDVSVSVKGRRVHGRLLAGDHWAPAPLDRACSAIRQSFEPFLPHRFAEDAVTRYSKQLQRLARTVAHGGGQGLDRWCWAAWGMISQIMRGGAMPEDPLTWPALVGFDARAGGEDWLLELFRAGWAESIFGLLNTLASATLDRLGAGSAPALQGRCSGHLRRAEAAPRAPCARGPPNGSSDCGPAEGLDGALQRVQECLRAEWPRLLRTGPGRGLMRSRAPQGALRAFPGTL